MGAELSEKQIKIDNVYMSMAYSMSTLSHGKRAKVGAVLVTENGVCLTGYNGLPKPLGNDLEYEDENGNLVSHQHVTHAELNCILKAAREGVSVVNSTIYTTLSCCTKCATMLAEAGVKRVVYGCKYRDVSGISILKQCGIVVEKIVDNDS